MARKRAKHLIIFDTTLRDGEQSPGASLNIEEKLLIARQLASLKVDVIEAGFPVASPGDFEAVRRVAMSVRGPVVAGLARALPLDIESAAKALEKARKTPRIHVFLATSEIHRKYKLRKACAEILKLAAAGVRLARKYTPDVEFSPEDASRTEPEFLAEVVEAVIAAGAATVNIPDTVGYALPGPFGRLIAMLMSEVPNIGDAVISVHCHNDLGLGVANSLAAVEAGARQVECTINGLGERAGNASLEEIVMTLKTRRDHYGVTTGIETKQIYPTSHMVSTLTGIQVQRNKAVVGANAFAHEAGVHQDGVLKARKTYEIMSPASIGLKTSTLVLGKHSGRHALKARIAKLGYVLDDAQLDRVFEEFKRVADKKKEIFDADLVAIVEEEAGDVRHHYELVDFHVSSGTSTFPTATVTLKTAAGEKLRDAACAAGPIEAIFRTVDRITGLGGKRRGGIRLVDYSLRAITGGKDAVGEVSLQIEHKGRRYRGHGVSTDVLESSIKAYVNAVNKLHTQLEAESVSGRARRRRKPSL